MGLTDLIKKTLLVEAKLDATDLTRGATTVGKALDSTAVKATNLGEKLEKGLDRGWAGLSKFGGGLNSAVGKLNDFAAKLGPWNQALELGGKAVHVLDDAMGAYAKTSVEAAQAVGLARANVAAFSETASEALGEATTKLLTFNAAGNAVSNMFYGMARDPVLKSFLDSFNKARGPELTPYDVVRRQMEETRTAITTSNAIFGLADSGKSLANSLVAGQTWSNFSLEDAAGKLRSVAEASRRAREENARWRAEMAAFSSQSSTSLTDDLVKRLEAEQNAHATSTSVEKYKADLAKNTNRFKGLSTGLSIMPGERLGTPLGGESGRSYLSRALGPLDEYSTYQNAFSGLGDAAGAAYESIVSGQGGIASALKTIAQQQLMSLGKLEVVEGIKELAWGISQAASGPLGAAVAGAHFKSSALHFAAAAAAGVGSAAFGGGGGGGGGSSLPPGVSIGAGGARVSSEGRAPTPTTTTTINIIQGDSHSEDSPRIRRRNAEKVVALGLSRTQGIAGDF